MSSLVFRIKIRTEGYKVMKAQFLFPLFGLLFAMRTLGSAPTMGAEEIFIGALVALTARYSRT